MTAKILAIDDEFTCLEVIKFSLTSRGYEVVTASGGEEAIDYLKKNPNSIQLILLDMMMPGMCGITTLAEIKKIKEARHIPVIIQTGTTNYTEIKKAIEDGDVTFIIRKPYSRDELLKLVESALNTESASHSTNNNKNHLYSL
jgi:CheY-like chemotaxis protein